MGDAKLMLIERREGFLWHFSDTEPALTNVRFQENNGHHADVARCLLKPMNFHESYLAGEIKPPSERSTGLLFGAVAVIVAAVA